MIPGNPDIYQITESNRFLVSTFQPPDNRSSSNELEDWEYGGIALQDPSEGLQYQIWKGYWNSADSTAYLQPEDSSVPPIPIFVESDVVEFTFTFDQNMRWAAAIRKDDKTVKFRWYNSVIENYTTTTYSGIVSVRLCHDDKRAVEIFSGTSDMILTYSKTGAIYWRIQRDRFITEYSHSLAISDQHRITHFGMNKLNRLQWRIGLRRKS